MDIPEIDATEPRSAVIVRHVQGYLAHSGTSNESFAESVREGYHRRVPETKRRSVHFHEGGDLYRDMQANGLLVYRMLNGTTRLPVDLEEPLVLALPDPWRQLCLQQLSWRVGLRAVPLSGPERPHHMTDFHRLLSSCGDAFEKLAPILADGRVDKADRPHARPALRALRRALAELLQWECLVEEVLIDDEPPQRPEIKLAG